MKRCAFGLALFVLAVLPASLHAIGGNVLTENFDELTPGPSLTSVGQFSAIGGTDIDIVGGVNGSYFPTLCVAPESGNCIDLDGSSGNPQGILQSNSAIPAGTYYLSFNLVGSQRGNTTSTTVAFGPYNQTFTLASGDVSSGVVVNVPVTLTSASNLTFTSNTPGLAGALLDNVVISTAPSTPLTPAPSSLLLMLTGCAALLAYVLWSRRRLA
jgi:hypothetical protein